MWACPLCSKRIAVKNIQTQGVVRKAAPFFLRFHTLRATINSKQNHLTHKGASRAFLGHFPGTEDVCISYEEQESCF